MRIIVAGSRTITDPKLVEDAIRLSPFGEDMTTLISGAAPGVDTLAEAWAEVNGIPIEWYPARWDLHGKAAGPIRNSQMANVADGLIAVWDGKSRGTKDMINKANAKHLLVYVKLVNV